jgi:solute carrier family 35 protein E3
MDAVGAAIGSNIVSSVALVLVNKRTVAKDGFSFVVVLTGLHFYMCFICCLLLLAFGMLQYKMVRSYTNLLRISAASLASIIFMNLNLSHNSIGFYQVSKLLCIPVSLGLEMMFGMSKEKMNRLLVSSLAMIIGGMFLIIRGEALRSAESLSEVLNVAETIESIEEDPFAETSHYFDHSHLGLLYMLLGVLATSVAQVWFSPLQKELGLNSLQLLFHTSPVMAFCSFVLTPLTEDTDALMKFSLSKGVLGDLLLSSFMAFFLNASNYKVLEMTTPLTYQVVGQVKAVVIIAGGMLFFDKRPNGSIWSGMLLSTAGMVLYYYYKTNKSVNNSSSSIMNQGGNASVSVSTSLKPKSSPAPKEWRDVEPVNVGTRSSSNHDSDNISTTSTKTETVFPHDALLKKEFEAAAKAITHPNCNADPSQAQKLQLYACFKYSEKGAAR